MKTGDPVTGLPRCEVAQAARNVTSRAFDDFQREEHADTGNHRTGKAGVDGCRVSGAQLADGPAGGKGDGVLHGSEADEVSCHDSCAHAAFLSGDGSTEGRAMEQAEDSKQRHHQRCRDGTARQHKAARHEKRQNDHRLGQGHGDAGHHEETARKHRCDVGRGCDQPCRREGCGDPHGSDEEQVVEAQNRVADAGHQSLGEGVHRQSTQRVVGKCGCGGKCKCCGEKFLHSGPLGPELQAEAQETSQVARPVRPPRNTPSVFDPGPRGGPVQGRSPGLRVVASGLPSRVVPVA